MLIPLTPMRRDDRPSVARHGDVLTIGGVAYDFGPLPVGGVLPRAAIACDWIAGDVTRGADGRLVVPLILAHGPVPWPAPEAARVVLFPAPLDLAGDGPVVLPDWTPEVTP